MPTAMAKMDDTTLVQMVLAGQSEYFGEIMPPHEDGPGPRRFDCPKFVRRG
jgi:hypothetical protein